jgi:hypothetical protein
LSSPVFRAEWLQRPPNHPKARSAAKRPEPASGKKPLNQVQVLVLLAGQVPSHRVAVLVKERGIDFEVKDDYVQEVHLDGGDDHELINTLKSAKVTEPVTVDPAVQARQGITRRRRGDTRIKILLE